MLEWGIILPVEYSNEAITRYCSCGIFVLFWWKKIFGVILVMLPCHLLNDSSVTIVLCQIVLRITSRVMCKSVVIRRVDYKNMFIYFWRLCYWLRCFWPRLVLTNDIGRRVDLIMYLWCVNAWGFVTCVTDDIISSSRLWSWWTSDAWMSKGLLCWWQVICYIIIRLWWLCWDDLVSSKLIMSCRACKWLFGHQDVYFYTIL